MTDKIEKLGKSTIHHGKYSDRVYLMKLCPDDSPKLIKKMEALATEQGYSKIIAKIQARALPCFLANNYLIEAYIPNFYKNNQDCLFVAKYKNKERCQIPIGELKSFQGILCSSIKPNFGYKHSLKYILGQLELQDSGQIAEVFRQVFSTYPFPVFNTAYIKETMRENETRYFGLKDGGRLVGVSTAEMDIANQNAEMTDFAVLPEYRGQNFAHRLLAKMEEGMKCLNIKTLYTIARLKEAGMNKTFLKSGYRYTGTLANNTNIGGSIESMNIYYKHI